MVFLTCPESFSIPWFQNGDLKYFEMATTPLPSNFDGSPYPILGGTPIFFIKMTAKDVKEMS